MSNTNVLVYDIEADIYLASKSEVIHLTSSQIAEYSIDGSVESDCLPIGSTSASTFSMSFTSDKKYSAKDLDDARVVVRISLNGGEFQPFGMWYIDDVDASEQNPFTQIDGADALNTRFEDTFSSSIAMTHLALVQAAVAAASAKATGLSLATTDFHNYNAIAAAGTAWDENTTLRDVIGYVAACAGGFARINWAGGLEIITCGKGTKYTCDSSEYTEFSSTGGSSFDFNCLQYLFETEGDETAPEYTRYPIDESITDNACNTIQMSGNPLITTDAMCTDIRDTLKGCSYDGATVNWFGNTSVLPGDELTVTNMSSETHRLLITSLSISFDTGGLMADVSCEMPTLTAETSSYSSGTSVFNADGTVRYEAIEKANQKVIAATAAYIQNLTADSITTTNLLAALIDATTIRANNISALSADTDNLTAAFAAIVQASIKKLNAGTITTDDLIASLATIAVAQITTANIQKANIDWAQIEKLNADIAEIALAKIENAEIKTSQIQNLAADVAEIVKLKAQTGEFSLVDVTNLLSNALILKQGIADSMMITNLSVTSANLLNATVDKLVLKSSDGKYYHVFVGSDGSISTDEVTVTQEEIDAGQTSDGRQITATTANVSELNSQTVKAKEAVIGTIVTESLTAGKITATEAVLASAVIPIIYTDTIKALGSSIDISANTSITSTVTSVDAVSDAVETTTSKVEVLLSEVGTAQTAAETAQATADEAAEATKTLQTQVTQTNDALSIVQTTTTDLEGRVTTIESGVHISGSEIEIYASDSPYHNKITNDGWEITENGTAVITCAETKLTAPRIQVTDAMIIGNVAWKPGSDNHLRLLKYGR